MENLKDRKLVFESLHQQYFSMVRQLCLGYMKGDKDAAQDTAQEAFINIWNGLDKFRSEASYKTWIYRITVNTCLLSIRSSNKLQPTTELSDVHQEAPQEVKKGDEGYESLYRAIGELPHLERLIIMMVLEELSYEEITAITGISAVHLRVKIHRIKKKMRQLIKQE